MWVNIGQHRLFMGPFLLAEKKQYEILHVQDAF